MKTINKYALVSLVLLLCFGAAFIKLSSRHSKSNSKSTLAVNETKYVPISGIEQLSGYRKWFRVTPKPIYLDHEIASLCVIASPEQVAVSTGNPHDRKFFTVYVNAVAKNTMMKGKPSIFPVGSIIVKEKLPSEKSKSPELLTVMLKRQKGYNSANGDWEYLVLNGTASKIQSRGALQNCQSCHAFRKETDFVFGTYLPAEN